MKTFKIKKNIVFIQRMKGNVKIPQKLKSSCKKKNVSLTKKVCVRKYKSINDLRKECGYNKNTMSSHHILKGIKYIKPDTKSKSNDTNTNVYINIINDRKKRRSKKHKENVIINPIQKSLTKQKSSTNNTNTNTNNNNNCPPCDEEVIIYIVPTKTNVLYKPKDDIIINGIKQEDPDVIKVHPNAQMLYDKQGRKKGYPIISKIPLYEKKGIMKNKLNYDPMNNMILAKPLGDKLYIVEKNIDGKDILQPYKENVISKNTLDKELHHQKEVNKLLEQNIHNTRNDIKKLQQRKNQLSMNLPKQPEFEARKTKSEIDKLDDDINSKSKYVRNLAKIILKKKREDIIRKNKEDRLDHYLNNEEKLRNRKYQRKLSELGLQDISMQGKINKLKKQHEINQLKKLYGDDDISSRHSMSYDLGSDISSLTSGISSGMSKAYSKLIDPVLKYRRKPKHVNIKPYRKLLNIFDPTMKRFLEDERSEIGSLLRSDLGTTVEPEKYLPDDSKRLLKEMLHELKMTRISNDKKFNDLLNQISKSKNKDFIDSKTNELAREKYIISMYDNLINNLIDKLNKIREEKNISIPVFRNNTDRSPLTVNIDKNDLDDIKHEINSKLGDMDGLLAVLNRIADEGRKIYDSLEKGHVDSSMLSNTYMRLDELNDNFENYMIQYNKNINELKDIFSHFKQNKIAVESDELIKSINALKDTINQKRNIDQLSEEARNKSININQTQDMTNLINLLKSNGINNEELINELNNNNKPNNEILNIIKALQESNGLNSQILSALLSSYNGKLDNKDLADFIKASLNEIGTLNQRNIKDIIDGLKGNVPKDRTDEIINAINSLKFNQSSYNQQPTYTGQPPTYIDHSNTPYYRQPNPDNYIGGYLYPPYPPYPPPQQSSDDSTKMLLGLLFMNMMGKGIDIGIGESSNNQTEELDKILSSIIDTLKEKGVKSYDKEVSPSLISTIRDMWKMEETNVNELLDNLENQIHEFSPKKQQIIKERIALWRARLGITGISKEDNDIIKKEFAQLLAELRSMKDDTSYSVGKLDMVTENNIISKLKIALQNLTGESITENNPDVLINKLINSTNKNKIPKEIVDTLKDLFKCIPSDWSSENINDLNLHNTAGLKCALLYIKNLLKNCGHCNDSKPTTISSTPTVISKKDDVQSNIIQILNNNNVSRKLSALLELEQNKNITDTNLESIKDSIKYILENTDDNEFLDEKCKDENLKNRNNIFKQKCDNRDKKKIAAKEAAAKAAADKAAADKTEADKTEADKEAAKAVKAEEEEKSSEPDANVDDVDAYDNDNNDDDMSTVYTAHDDNENKDVSPNNGDMSYLKNKFNKKLNELNKIINSYNNNNNKIGPYKHEIDTKLNAIRNKLINVDETENNLTTINYIIKHINDNNIDKAINLSNTIKQKPRSFGRKNSKNIVRRRKIKSIRTRKRRRSKQHVKSS